MERQGMSRKGLGLGLGLGLSQGKERKGNARIDMEM
jgi:hypothetical protein